MSGGNDSLVLDGQSTSQRALKNAREMAALQGANIAFSANKLRSSSSNAPHNPSKTARAAVLADQARHAKQQPSEDDTGSEMPEDGFVTDRIKQFSGAPTPARIHTTNTGGHLAVRDVSIPIQAASLAAARSASRTPQSARPTPSVSPIRIQPSGPPNDVNAKTPKLERSPGRISQPLPAPIPVRKSLGVIDSLAKITDLDKDRTNSVSPTQRSSSTLTTGAQPLRNPTPRKAANDRPKSAATTTHLSLENPSQLPTPTNKEVQAERHDRKPAPAVPKPRRTATVPDEEPPKPALPPRTATLSLEDEGHTSSSSAAEEKINSNRRRVRSTSVSTRSSYNTSSSDQVRVSNHAQSAARLDSGDANRMTKEALADAIVASSLASSRAVSPLKEAPPLPPNRRARSRSLLHPADMFKGEPQRTTPSPPKGLRQTLRDPSKSDDEGAKKHGGRHLIRHHPHKYHEGDRRRWRQEIPERERKRYEGVWAANKGLCVPPQAVISKLFPRLPASVVLSDMVVHLVVRDIWSRSRLPFYTLEGIWNLVDHHGIGLLSREEFVVGLWLIDQSLKGHKIPVKVPDSVWESVRHTPGIKVPLNFE
jgi:hypothetical protein